MVGLILAMFALVLATAGSAFAQQYRGGYGQAMSDRAQVEFMNAQSEALEDYVRCLQHVPATPGSNTSAGQEPSACIPPARAQIPQDQPSQYRGGYGQATLDTARNRLLQAQAQAIRAYTQCLKATKPPAACGPSP